MKLRTAPGSPVSRGLAVIAAAGLLAAGCSNGSTTDQSSTPKTLVIGYTADPNTLDPWKATQFQAIHMLEQIYGTLTQLDANLDVVPGLAEKWSYADDNKTLTLTVRQGVKFHDGTAFTSEDVKSSLDRIKDKATAAVAAATLASVQSVDAPDASTVVLHLASPDAGLLAGLASTNVAMVSKDDTQDTIATKPNGTNAFSFVSRTANQSITLTANQNYWGAKPKLAGLEFRIIPDETSVVAALQSGNVQFAALNDPLVAKTAERRRDHPGQDAEPGLPRVAAQRAYPAAGQVGRAAGHPVRDRPAAGARHGGARRRRRGRPDHFAGLQVRPQVAPLPHP